MTFVIMNTIILATVQLYITPFLTKISPYTNFLQTNRKAWNYSFNFQLLLGDNYHCVSSATGAYVTTSFAHKVAHNKVVTQDTLCTMNNYRYANK